MRAVDGALTMATGAIAAYLIFQVCRIPEVFSGIQTIMLAVTNGLGGQ